MHRDTPRHLRHAQGYLELRMLSEAADELDAIASTDRLKPPVLAVRLELEMAAEHWDAVVDIGSNLARETPENERAWICWAYALREVDRVVEARAVLLSAETMHGQTSAILHYNLACYDCLLGDLVIARERLERACKMEPCFEDDARDDPDLAALWR